MGDSGEEIVAIRRATFLEERKDYIEYRLEEETCFDSSKL